MIKIFLITLLISFPVYAQHRTVATPIRLQKPIEQLTLEEKAELLTLKVGDIPLTVEEITVLNTKQAAWEAIKPMRDWQRQMDSVDLSPDLENIIDAMDAPTRSRLSAETLDKYNTKKSLRLLKP